ncbi:hypothetical protein GGX14DRAFT_390700 [Mycena pura]|uniref:Uncharacterized protein n=1 Tax=Mycena pura TaxID=153505 RepID=A0AAD6YJ59_9AGAR|nr:hypothetical protein GGX14DRAFT_390700 [Mycena pura]
MGSPYPCGYTGFTRVGTSSIGYTRVTRGYTTLISHVDVMPAVPIQDVPKGEAELKLEDGWDNIEFNLFYSFSTTRTLPAGKPVPVPTGTGAQPPRVRVQVAAGIPTGLPVPMPKDGHFQKAGLAGDGT